MKKIGFLASVTLALLPFAADGANVIAEGVPARALATLFAAEPTVESSRFTACRPTDSVDVDHFTLALDTMASEITIRFLVNGESYGTETLTLELPVFPEAARLSLLRFQPEERLRLIHLSEAGASVEVHIAELGNGPVTLASVRSADAASTPTAEATIVRSTWSTRQDDEPNQTSLRRVTGSQTFLECQGVCKDARRDCEDNNCWYPDPQCLWMCENDYNFCVDDCPCTGFDPVLVDQYVEQDRFVVSGPHGTTCRYNNFGPGNVLYSIYTVFTRSTTYRVWEDCHGDQTTELVSVHDSSNHTCYAISQQACSPAVGPAPCVLF